MAIFLGRRMVLAAKIEAVEGTPETLANADANLLIYDAEFEPSLDQFERAPLAADLSQFGPIAGKVSGTMRFKAELKGSGTAGTAPAIGKLLMACGASQTLVAVTSATYAPLTLAIPSLTIGLYSTPESGTGPRMMIAGSRGSWRFSAKVGEPVMLEFEFKGTYQTVADAASLVVTGLETTKPVALLGTSFTVHTFSLHKISTLTIDLANEVMLRTDIAAASGFFSALIVDKKPKFSFDPELETVATHDYFLRMRENTEASLSLAISGGAGNITTITAPRSQYTQVRPGMRDKIRILNVDGQLNRNTGNDEWSIAFT